MRKGKMVMPPKAMKFPAAKGDIEKGRKGKERARCSKLPWMTMSEFDCDEVGAANTGILDSHAPRMKKQVIENQHMVATTPH